MTNRVFLTNIRSFTLLTLLLAGPSLEAESSLEQIENIEGLIRYVDVVVHGRIAPRALPPQNGYGRYLFFPMNRFKGSVPESSLSLISQISEKMSLEPKEHYLVFLREVPGVSQYKLVARYPVPAAATADLEQLRILVEETLASPEIESDYFVIEPVSFVRESEESSTSRNVALAAKPLSLEIPQIFEKPRSPELPTKADILFDSFENGIFGWIRRDEDLTNGEAYWGDTTYRPWNGARSAWCAGAGANAPPQGSQYPLYMDSWMIYGPFNLSDAVAGSFSFQYYNRSEANFDFFSYLVSTDNVNFHGNTVSGNMAFWNFGSIDFSNAPFLGDLRGSPSVWVAFRFTSDFTITDEGAYVDDVRIEKTVGADIVISNPTSNVSPLSPNQAFTVSYQVRNDGSQFANFFRNDVYLSTNTIVDFTDHYLGSSFHSLSGFQLDTARVSAVTPANLASGNYFLLFVGDAGEAIVESNETNNISAIATSVIATPSTQVRIRKNISTLSAAELESLRAGIRAMEARPEFDPTSWIYQANIHGVDGIQPSSFSPLSSCQHGNYFFLSWHRMYLYYFERILRRASGDQNLTLPYWNYRTQPLLPAPFRSPANHSINPLYISQRDPNINLGFSAIPSSAFGPYTTVSRYPLNFTAQTIGGLSFGGGHVNSPTHFGNAHGRLEVSPHNVVHGIVGGFNGWMCSPNLAARDPIFWLHHANIDRIWESWIRLGGGRSNPADATWRDTQFTFFDENGQRVILTGKEIVETANQLQYEYDQYEQNFRHEDSDPAEKAVSQEEPDPALEDKGTESTDFDILTFEENHFNLGSERSTISLQPISRLPEKNKNSQFVLHIGGVNAFRPLGIYYEIYVNLPAGEDPHFENPHYVGNLAVFSSGTESHHHGGGMTFNYDLSHVIRALEEAGDWAGDLWLTFEPRGGEPVPGAPPRKAEPAIERLLSFTNVVVIHTPAE